MTGSLRRVWSRLTTQKYSKMAALLTCAAIVAAPMTADKQDLIDMEEPHLINGLEAFSEAAMAEFMLAMNANGASE